MGIAYEANADGAVETVTNWTPNCLAGGPTSADTCELNGFDMNTTTKGSWSIKALTDLMAGGGTLTLGTGTFTCPYVKEVKIIVPNGKTAVIAFGTTGLASGCHYSSGGYAIAGSSGSTIGNVTGDLTISGPSNGVSNIGTWSDFDGNIYKSGLGIGCLNSGIWSDFSGNIYNSGSGDGIFNDGDWSDFSGNLYNSGAGTGIFNDGDWSQFSGKLYHSGSGDGISNNTGDWIDFSGDLYHSGSNNGINNAVSPSPGAGWIDFTGNLWLGSTAITSSGICGFPIPFSGDIKIMPQADLAAANIRDGKTILGVTGTVALTGFGPYPIGSVAVGPFPIEAASIGPYHVV